MFSNLILHFPVLSNFRAVNIECRCDMSFSLGNLGFSTIGEDLDLAMDNPLQPISGSVPSSGESSRRSCSRCHGRMSSFSVD